MQAVNNAVDTRHRAEYKRFEQHRKERETNELHVQGTPRYLLVRDRTEEHDVQDKDRQDRSTRKRGCGYLSPRGKVSDFMSTSKLVSSRLAARVRYLFCIESLLVMSQRRFVSALNWGSQTIVFTLYR